ncbi:phosphotransferase family protein [Nocardia sp. NPDC055029]
MYEKESARRIEAHLRARLSEIWARPVTVQNLRRLSGGASRHTWLLEAVPIGEQPRRLVLRCDPSDRPNPEIMAIEAAALTAAAAAHVPVPQVIDHSDGTTGMGSAYLLMEHVEGETIPRRLLRDGRYAGVRPRLAAELGRILARIHSIPLDAVPGLAVRDPLQELISTYRAFDEPRPAIELGLRWLAEHSPKPRSTALVHGDFRNGNLIVDQDGVRAVLDWELTHLGNPMEDLGWLCVKAWRFGTPAPVGGFGCRDQLLAGYAEIAGTCPDAEELHWWEVFGTVRWAVLCRVQAERFFSGAETSVEFAVLGRRVCEQEHDILLALGMTEPTSVPDVLTVQSSDTAAFGHDRPSGDVLLRAVQDLLSHELTRTDDVRLNYLGRVAANAIAIARREFLLASAQAPTHRARLAELGYGSGRALAEAIRDDSLDTRSEKVLDAIRREIADKLAVANPDYLAQPTS